MLQTAAFRALSEQVPDRVHDGVAGDFGAADRHRGFTLTHLCAGALPFAALPALLAFAPAPSAFALAGFAVLVAPIVAALDLARSGALDRAVAVAALAYAALAALLASATGGLHSPALVLLALPVLDAVLAGAWIGLRFALAGAAAAVAALVCAEAVGVAAPPLEPALAVMAAIAFGSYALGLAFRAAAVLPPAVRRAGAPTAEPFEGFACALDDLVTRHAPDGAATLVSGAAWTLLETSPRDLAGQGLFARVHVADRPAYLQALAGAGEGGRTRLDIRLRRGGGAAFPVFGWFEMSARLLTPQEAPEAARRAAPIVATFRDLAARKAAEEALVAAREAADRASLAKTRLLAQMSHELRTPLTAIMGFSEILSDETLPALTPERRADYAALINRSGAHLLDLVDSILDMSRIESGAFAVAPRPCALRPLVADCLRLLALKAETAGVRLVAEIDPATAEIEADPRAVTQMLINLVANAIKFTPRGGEVRVLAAPGPDSVSLIVRDTGCGVAPEHVARLGEPFFQVEAPGRTPEGAGLGLSVVRGLVALHGGEFSVESAPGRGASVVVRLPRSRREAPPAVIPQISAQKVSLRA